VLSGVQHCTFVVSDLDGSRRFYREVLGLEEVPRPDSFDFGGAWFRVGAVDEIHLIAQGDGTARAGRADHGTSGFMGFVPHVALESDDLDAALGRAAEHGVLPASGPVPRGDGVTQAFVLDPDGYVIELFARTGES
jgi:catechol 2,3-dioxygenase-like lactoylglutathione lyase family enzyme